MMNDELKFSPSTIRAVPPSQPGPPSCSSPSCLVQSHHLSFPEQGSSPTGRHLPWQRGGKWRVPGRVGKRDNTREVGGWARGLCYLLHLKGAKQHCLFSLPGINVQFSILSAVGHVINQQDKQITPNNPSSVGPSASD